MGYKEYWVVIAAAGATGAMLLRSIFTSHRTDGWSKPSDSWTYIRNEQTHTGQLQASEGQYYIDLSTGHTSTGSKQTDGKWYFFRPNGLMVMDQTNLEDGE